MTPEERLAKARRRFEKMTIAIAAQWPLGGALTDTTSDLEILEEATRLVAEALAAIKYPKR